MKIKIFEKIGNEVENEINEFIKDKKIIDIKISEAMGQTKLVHSRTILIMYE